jgi:Holliday junction resolvase RusA-like endonuclease
MTESFLKITLPGQPVPKGRPRARIAYRGKKPFISFYQPPETVAYEQRLAQEAFLLVRGRCLLSGALCLEMKVYIAPPKSWSAKKTGLAIKGEILPTSRPDADNYLKIIDALNGVVWEDDAQIVKMSVEKHYSTDPRLEIDVCKDFHEVYGTTVLHRLKKKGLLEKRGNAWH